MDSEKTARVAVQSLRDELARNATIRPAKILTHVQRIYDLCGDAEAPMIAIHRELLHHRAISVVVGCLGRLCTDNLRFVTVARQKSIILCLAFLARSLHSRERICETLDSGFLPIFVKSTRCLDSDTVVEVSTTIITILYQHLVYRSVLRCFVKTKDLQALAKTYGIDGRFPKWSVFMAEVERMLGYKKQFEQEKKNLDDPGVKYCANKEVLIPFSLNK